MQQSIMLLPTHTRTDSSQKPPHFVTQRSQSFDKRPQNTVSLHVGLGKQKILPKAATPLKQDRRSESHHQQKTQQKSLQRYRKLNASTGQGNFTPNNPLKQYKRQALRSQLRAGLTVNESGLRGFLMRVQECETRFVNCCHEQQYEQAGEVIVRLLNYAVDYNQPEHFLKALKLLADLHYLTDHNNQAFFYYDQTRQGCLLLESPALLVESLMGLADCCGKAGVENEGIRILKKALEYSWLYNLGQKELRLYDEIGKLHYHLGDLQKAKQYHSRHVNAIHQPNSSALRLLSHQRVLKAEQVNLETKYSDISLLLLVHLKAPIKTLKEIPLPFQIPAEYNPVRSHFNISSKYFGAQEVSTEASQLLKGWFFREEMEDLSLNEGQTSDSKPKKFAYIDFKLNQQLRRLGTAAGREKERGRLGLGSRSLFPVKISLQEQVSRKMKETPLQADWYEKIVKQINRDHRNKLLNVRDAVRIRGFNRKTIPPLEAIRDLYNSFFQRPKTIPHSSFNHDQ